MNHLANRLRVCLAQAQSDAETFSTMRVLRNEADQRHVARLFKTFVADDNDDAFSRFPSFLKQIDLLLYEHGAGRKKKDEERQTDDIDDE